MVKTLDSFSTLLSLLTGTFLLEDELFHPSQEKISKAVADHQAAFTGLKKNLDEARSERLCDGAAARSRSGDLYEDAVDSLTRLAQHLNGLRSGTSLQYDLARAHRDGKVAIRRRPSYGNKTFANVLEPTKGKAAAEEEDDTEDVMLRAAAAMFGDLVGELDSPLRALSVCPARFSITYCPEFADDDRFFSTPGTIKKSTCTRAIGRLRETLSDQGASSADAESVLDESINLANGIQRALYEFDSTSNHALLRLYRGVDGSHADEILSGSDSEHIFLVYLYVILPLPGVCILLSQPDVLFPRKALFSRCRSSPANSFR
jgi:hypothetical protein